MELNYNMKNKIIFIDMDGVLADLDTAFIKWSGYHPDHHDDRSAFFHEFLPEYTKQNGFFTQETMPLCKKLVDVLISFKKNYGVNLAILTSAGYFVKPNTDVVIQKKKWIEKNVNQFSYIPFCATSSGFDKSFFAHQNAFLIDDHEKNIIEFINKGGNGFIYKEECFDELVKALEIFVNI